MYSVDVYDGLHTSVLPNDMDHSQLSESTCSSLNSSFLNQRIVSNIPLHIHADSLESLDEMIAENQSAEIMALKNTSALCDDLRYISGMPEVCDVKFIVGQEKAVLYGVKAILATRSRVFYEMIISAKKQMALMKDAKPVKKKSHFLKKVLKWRKGKSAPEESRIPVTMETDYLPINIHDFCPDTIKRVLLYLHCGSTSVTIQSVIGVMNAADVYGVEDLREACFEFALRFIKLNTTLKLLILSANHSYHRWTKTVISKIYEFIDKNSRDVIRLPEFETLPMETALGILGRSELTASEEDKWDAALKWCRRHTGRQGMFVFQSAISKFVPKINFIEIPLPKLRREIRPLCVVPDDIINRAIVQQASCRLVIGQEKRPVSRRNTVTSRPERPTVDSLTWARRYVQRRSSFNSTSSNSSRTSGYDSGFISSSDEGYMV